MCLGNNELPVELLSGTTCTVVVRRWALPGQITGSLEWVIESAESVGTSFTTQSRHFSPTFLSRNINIGAIMISGFQSWFLISKLHLTTQIWLKFVCMNGYIHLLWMLEKCVLPPLWGSQLCSCWCCLFACYWICYNCLFRTLLRTLKWPLRTITFSSELRLLVVHCSTW